MIENDVNQPIKYDPMEKRNEFIDHPSYIDSIPSSKSADSVCERPLLASGWQQLVFK